MTQSTTFEVPSTPTVDDALILARVLPIIPLRQRSKEPRVQNWQRRGTTDEATIRQWWQTWPQSNIGYVIPRGQFVIDIDPRNGGDVGWKNVQARHGDLPATWRVLSGRHDGGGHHYYTIPAGVLIPTITDIDQGVQILGPGHLLVLPPSVHPNTGEPYAWDPTCSPFTRPTPAPAPWWLLTLLVETDKRRHGPRTTPPERSQDHSSAPNPRSTLPSSPGTRCTPPRPTPNSWAAHPPSKGYGDHAAKLLRDPASLPALRTVLGFPADLQDGMSVHCPCSEHTHGDRNPSGIWREPKGTTLDYGVWCCKAQQFYTLNELFHFREGSDLLHLHREVEADGTRHEHRRSFLLWGLRLLERARLMMVPKEWGYPMLPRSAPEDCQTLLPIILDIKRFRNATEHGSKEPLPLSYDFLRDWAPAVRHWGHKRMQEAFTWLVSHGLLRRAGQFTTGCKQMWLWCVGGLALRQARKDAPVERTIIKAVESVEATIVPEPVEHTGHAWSAMAPYKARCSFADEPGHHDATCGSCTSQRRLEEIRMFNDIRNDPDDPYGRRSLASGTPPLAGVPLWTT